MLLKILRIRVIRVRPNWNSPDFKKASEEQLVQMFQQFPEILLLILGALWTSMPTTTMWMMITSQQCGWWKHHQVFYHFEDITKIILSFWRLTKIFHNFFLFFKKLKIQGGDIYSITYFFYVYWPFIIREKSIPCSASP